MFDTLLSLPLFQGLGHNDLTRILESTHLRFETHQNNHPIIHQDELCTGLTFILDGSVMFQTEAADRSWSVDELMPTPSVVGLEVLYGSRRTHNFSVRTCAQTHILHIDKRTVAALTGYFEVFRINVLNTLSAAIAHQSMPLWMPATASLEGRIVSFLRAHVQRPAGHKIFHISLRTLGMYLGEDYRYVSRAIHELSELGLMKMRRGSITIPNFEELVKAKL